MQPSCTRLEPRPSRSSSAHLARHFRRAALNELKRLPHNLKRSLYIVRFFISSLLFRCIVFRNQVHKKKTGRARGVSTNASLTRSPARRQATWLLIKLHVPRVETKAAKAAKAAEPTNGARPLHTPRSEARLLTGWKSRPVMRAAPLELCFGTERISALTLRLCPPLRLCPNCPTGKPETTSLSSAGRTLTAIRSEPGLAANRPETTQSPLAPVIAGNRKSARRRAYK